jgi:hypothetical protein
LDLAAVAQNAQSLLNKKVDKLRPWECPFDKDYILKIWKTPKHFLKTDEEKLVNKLLNKYNGTISAFLEAVEESRLRSQNMAKLGSHVKWDKFGGVPMNDVDLRARQVCSQCK